MKKRKRSVKERDLRAIATLVCEKAKKKVDLLSEFENMLDAYD